MRNPKSQQALRRLRTPSRVSCKISNPENGMPLHGGPWGRFASDATVRSGSADPGLVRHQWSTVMISNLNSVLVLALGYDLFGAASIHAQVLDLPPSIAVLSSAAAGHLAPATVVPRPARSRALPLRRPRSGQSLAFNMR